MLQGIKAAVVERLGINRVARATDRTADELRVLRAELERLASNERQLDETNLWVRVTTNTELVRTLFAPEETSISVILPTRNRARLLGRAIDSVLAQQHRAWQLVVVDDGSTDDTAQVLAGYTDPRIACVTGAGRGSAAARNLGLAHATGEWVAFLDDDNLMAPGWLHAIALFAAGRPEMNVLYGAQVRQREPSAETPVAEALALFDEQVTPATLATYGRLDMGVLAVRRDTEELFFDESLRRFVDWELTVRLAAVTKFLPVPVWASFYCTEAGNRITTPESNDAIAAFVARLADPADAVGKPGRPR